MHSKIGIKVGTTENKGRLSSVNLKGEKQFYNISFVDTGVNILGIRNGYVYYGITKLSGGPNTGLPAKATYEVYEEKLNIYIDYLGQHQNVFLTTLSYQDTFIIF